MDSSIVDQIYNEIKREYIEDLREELDEREDTLIAFPDIHVWFFNRNSQRVLPEAKKVWETLLSAPTGRKSLYCSHRNKFITAYATLIVAKHSRLVYLHKQLIFTVIPMKMSSLQESLNSYQSLTALYPELKDTEIEPLVVHRNLAFLENTGKVVNGETIGNLEVFLYVAYVDIKDLRTAFEEGFEGYSLTLDQDQTTSSTPIVDIRGNKALFSATFCV